MNTEIKSTEYIEHLIGPHKWRTCLLGACFSLGLCLFSPVGHAQDVEKTQLGQQYAYHGGHHGGHGHHGHGGGFGIGVSGPGFYGPGPGFYGAGYQHYRHNNNWIWYSGMIPAAAIILSNTSRGEPIYSCSAMVNGMYYNGSFYNGKCHIYINDRHYKKSQFRINVN